MHVKSTSLAATLAAAILSLAGCASHPVIEPASGDAGHPESSSSSIAAAPGPAAEK